MSYPPARNNRRMLKHVQSLPPRHQHRLSVHSVQQWFESHNYGRIAFYASGRIHSSIDRLGSGSVRVSRPWPPLFRVPQIRHIRGFCDSSRIVCFPMPIDFWTFGVQSLVIRARMFTMRPFALRLVGLCLVLAVSGYVSPLSNGFASQNGRGGIEPVLRLEKPRYVEGEAVRFWVGVKPKNSPTIPRELWKPCSLSVTRPDGTRRVDSIGWPIDGMIDHAWSGGWGFGDEKVEPGVYVLVLECAGEKTAPLELIVEQSEILAQIKAQFRFEREGAITKSTHVPIVLTVDNGSQETIRFPL